MEKTKKILVIVDTNKLGNYEKRNLSCSNYKYFGINKHLHQSLIDNFSFKSQKDTIIQVAIPEIVLEELKQQQKNKFEEDLKKIGKYFEKFKELEGSELKLPEINYESYLDTKKSSYLGVYGIKKIKMPSNEILSKLINKVLNKIKPFYKKDNDVDSGFKDALIWESILEFVSINKYDKYFFLTNDPDFDDGFLKKEFLENTGKDIYIVKEIADLKGMLEEEIKGTTLINESLEKIYNVLAKEFRNVIYSNYVEIISSGNIYDVQDAVDFQILDINLSQGNFVLSALFYLEHESLYSIHARYGAFDQTFMNHTETSPAEINFVIDKNYKIKKIDSGDILINRKHEEDF